MELEHRFTVPANVDDAWAAFNDLERIAPCFPGAALTSYDGEKFDGLVKVKLGPISLQYTGSGSFTERDEAAKRAVIEAKGKDKRGNGTAAATITAQLTANGDATDVLVSTDLNITGKPAQFGRGVMQDVSDKLLAQFASCLESKLGAQEEEVEPVAAQEAAATERSEPTTAAAVAGLATTEPAGTDPVGDTPIAREAAESAAKHRAESASQPAAPAAELDLGATLLPVLLKRYAPQLIGLLVVLLVLKRLFGRR